MTCAKCQGLMVLEHTWQGGCRIELMYCINCGMRFDGVIAVNKSVPKNVGSVSTDIHVMEYAH